MMIRYWDPRDEGFLGGLGFTRAFRPMVLGLG